MSNSLTFKEIKRKPGLYRAEYGSWFLTFYSPREKKKKYITLWLGTTGHDLEIAESCWDGFEFKSIIMGDGSEPLSIRNVAQIIQEYKNMGIESVDRYE